ncbi:MAG TPA: SRPBCC domain-containing protein [Fimbriimonas sp.]|nr:SRPBCC domain-containing protein [Fimbriimonas sp.]
MNKALFTFPSDTTLRMERVFPASGHNLWQAYADPAVLGQWFSPKGWDTEVYQHDFVEGGEFVYAMKCVDEAQDWFGQKSCGKMVFGKISPETTFEYRDFFTDEEGVVNEDMPSSHTQVTITELGPNESKLTVETTYASAEALQQVLAMGMEEGYGQTLDKLESLLSA